MADTINTTPGNQAPSPFPPPLPAGQSQASPPAGQAQSQTVPPPAPPKFVFTYANEYGIQGEFGKDITEFSSCANLITGFPCLDRIQPFYPGLYCLGAISSLGKTTFAQQLADQAAASGQWVIYFSLEQTRFELYSKSMARGFFLKERTATAAGNGPSLLPTPSSIDIRRGIPSASYPQALQEQIDRYDATVRDRMCIVHGAFSMTVEDIIAITEQLIKQVKQAYHTDIRPLVIVDYLQIVSPTQINGRIPDSKTAMDHVVHSLKIMQAQYGLTVLAISSLNRTNYLTPVDFESFKESGGIEYTADVIWGLQLAIMNCKEFLHRYDENTGKRKGETSLTERRAMVNRAKAQYPREIDLVCLKNRYGVASYTRRFDYYPANDLFWMRPDPNDPDTAFRY